jgi:hypothetical protein
MTLEELKDNLESLGPDLKKWPKILAEAALDLLETSMEAQDLYAGEVQDDALIRAAFRAARQPR